MKTQKHIIQQQVVEVDFYDRSATQDVFAQFSRLFKTKLGDITNTLLDNTVNAHNFLKIDQLELNIGTLIYPFTDDEFAYLYEQALEKALFDYATLHTINNTDVKLENVQNFLVSCTELLHFFLSNGVLPWWASGDVFTQPDKTFLKLLDENPEQLKGLILKTGVEEQVRKRLSQQFNDDIVISIIKLIIPFQANFISRYFDNVVKIQKQEQIVQAQEKVFGQALWYFILTYLLVDMGGHFERKLFVKSTLSQMASHFNVSYQSILNLLADAIQTNPELIQSDKNFTVFIKELREEARTGVEVNESLDSEVYLEKTAIKNDFEALHYYFFFGSLPFEYGYYTSQKISLLLDVIIKKHPEEFINVFRKQHNIVQFTERLMLVAPEATLLTIIRIMETTKSDFIISYYQTTVKIQNKKNLIKTHEREFKKAILKFILSFLFTSHGSLFNAKMFVENNIRKLAQHYNVDYQTLLLLMTQGMAEAHAIVKDQSSLFFIFTEILGEIRNSTKSTLSAETIIPEKEGNKEDVKKSKKEKIDKTYTDNLSLQDLFLFWFTHATIPWWAKEQKNTTIAELFQELANAEPTIALLIIKQAAQLGFRKHEILNSVSKSVLQLFRMLPDDESVLKIWNEFQQLEAVSKIGISTDSLQGFVLKSILETYHQLQFNSFDAQHFYAILIHYLKNAAGISEDKLEKFFTIQFEENKLPHLKSKINVNTKEKDNQYDIYKSILFSDRNAPDITSALDINDEFSYNEFKLLTKSNDIFKMPLSTLVQKAYDILKYYLLHNKLPNDIKIDDQSVIAKIMERLVIVIFEQDQNLLHNLMRQDNASPTAKMTLHNSFSKYSNQQGRNIANLLKEYEEKDFLIYIKQTWKQDQVFTNLNEIIYFIKHQSSDFAQQQLHKQVLQLANTTLHYAGIYKGAEFTSMIKSLADNTLQELIANYIYILNIAIKDSFEREKLLLYFREFSFYWVAQTNAENANLFFYRFLAFLNHKRNWDIKRFYQQLIKVPNDIKQLNNTSLQTIVLSIQKDTETYLIQHKHSQEIMYDVKDEVLKKLNFAENSIPTEMNEKKIETKYDDEVIKLKEGEKIYIENAGLVLVHPFLSALFERTGLVKNGEFVNDEAKFRAPHLLQYLVNFEQESPEQALLLNKILCGIDYQEAVTSGIVLTEIEMNTATELLFVVTQQWEKLKNTSINGLQESFLQRSGSLCLSSEGWTLVVESKAYDVLLQTLPWGLSFIKNSWMTEPIFVEWN
ncbi:contractile injection system tape measure protein [Flavobacterium pectinovorum]|uniref:contractile injection system tape measure protein n=1 Tax=Flavobacterium pectinovorum TaxID=29533 RepID=UPI00265EB5A8|nr:contractile injection system tape measure protein [Flavobacterium pectinovorum]WKL50485.1 contractile injection system tape measure protein [Flavobacterium pectinovorum]